MLAWTSDKLYLFIAVLPVINVSGVVVPGFVIVNYCHNYCLDVLLVFHTCPWIYFFQTTFECHLGCDVFILIFLEKLKQLYILIHVFWKKNWLDKYCLDILYTWSLAILNVDIFDERFVDIVLLLWIFLVLFSFCNGATFPYLELLLKPNYEHTN